MDYNLVQDEQDERKKRAERNRIRQLNDLDFLVSTSQGKRFLWRLLEQCKVYHSSFTGEASTTFFNEGARSIGLFILSEMIHISPDAMVHMRREAELTAQQDAAPLIQGEE